MLLFILDKLGILIYRKSILILGPIVTSRRRMEKMGKDIPMVGCWKMFHSQQGVAMGTREILGRR